MEPPSGSPAPDEFEAARRLMVERQISRRGIRNPRVLQAFRDVPRHEFVPPGLHSQSYLDEPLPIGHGQTISQPYIVAVMTEQLDLVPADTVLEIGTGSGYQAAILARLVAKVYTVEIVEDLAAAARATFQRLQIANVAVKCGDGHQGWAEHAPFDAIIVTCAPHRIPQPLIEQLGEGGRMVIPIGEALWQDLVILEKHNGRFQERAILPVLFVPMTGQSEGLEQA